MVRVVQLVRASDCGSECRRFEPDPAPKEKRRDLPVSLFFVYILFVAQNLVFFLAYTPFMDFHFLSHFSIVFILVFLLIQFRKHLRQAENALPAVFVYFCDSINTLMPDNVKHICKTK
jgi:hypothetical protein